MNERKFFRNIEEISPKTIRTQFQKILSYVFFITEILQQIFSKFNVYVKEV